LCYSTLAGRLRTSPEYAMPRSRCWTQEENPPMAYSDLQEFMAALERAGELRRVPAEVDPVLEITEITDRVSKQGGPALLFEQVKGSRMPLLINAFGSPAG